MSTEAGPERSFRSNIKSITSEFKRDIMTRDECADAIVALIPTWTKAEDGLPDDETFYRVIDSIGKEHHASYFKDGKCWCTRGTSQRLFSITHWQDITPPEKL